MRRYQLWRHLQKYVDKMCGVLRPGLGATVEKVAG